LKLYEKATEQEKSELLQHIKATKSIESLGIKRNYYINQDTQKPNEGGEVLAGSILAEQKNIGIEVRQSKFQNEVAEKHGYQIGYDQDDQVLILGIFQKTEQISQPQEQSQATEPQTKLIADQQEKIETDKKGLFNKFSNWFKN